MNKGRSMGMVPFDDTNGGDDFFGSMNARHKQMNQMAKEMMSGFGMMGK
jgi:hypothetical protein